MFYIFTPISWGNLPILTSQHIFQMWLVQPPTRLTLENTFQLFEVLLVKDKNWINNYGIKKTYTCIPGIYIPFKKGLYKIPTYPFIRTRPSSIDWGPGLCPKARGAAAGEHHYQCQGSDASACRTHLQPASDAALT